MGQDALPKFRNLMNPQKLLDTPFKGIRVLIEIYIFPKERIITARRAKFEPDVQGVGDSDYNFLVCQREEARYCDFQTLKTVNSSEEELVKLNLSQD